MNILQLITDAYSGYWNYIVYEIAHPGWGNYFYYLIVLSLAVWGLELIFPWRKNQKAIRKDFWLDAFYMFFNFFIFSLIGYNAISTIGVEAFNSFIGLFGIENKVYIQLDFLPIWARFGMLFVLADFIQWSVHVMLHRVHWMWQFHKVHHSVTEMGFAAHLRYHWMENVFYKTALYIPLSMIGFGLNDLFVLHAFNILIGHLNHANMNITYGPLKYIFNNPAMHIWHHVKSVPESHPNGINFGITLSVWDYLFKTAHVPHSGRDIELGFDEIEKYPKGFGGQSLEPFKK
jgi:sterol desaturase/sphingolipid hydroxylase (fatty acid hydroxylase superfamily)